MKSFASSRLVGVLALTIFVIFCPLSACQNTAASPEAIPDSTSHPQITAETSHDDIITVHSFSRVKLYDTPEELAQDSDLIVNGKVLNQQEVYDIDDTIPFTIVQVEVGDVLKGTPNNAVIEVRQTGLLEESFVVNGSNYLFFLVPSDLEGPQAEQYYITGATAGLYEVETPANSTTAARSKTTAATLERVDTESGDDLPSTMTVADLRDAINQ